MTVYFFLANNASYLVFASMPDFAIRLCHTKVMGYNRYIHIHSNDDSLFTNLPWVWMGDITDIQRVLYHSSYGVVVKSSQYGRPRQSTVCGRQFARVSPQYFSRLKIH